MKIQHGKRKYEIPNNHPLIDAILVLVNSAADSVETSRDPVPQRNDIKTLWRSLRRGHKRFLGLVAQYPRGLKQADVIKKLKVEPDDLRGVHNGLARICDGRGIDKPVSSSGYNAENRVYYMLPDVAATVLKLVEKDKE